MVIVDDFGWAEVGYHRETPTPEVVTPTIDALVKSGVELNRHYVHMVSEPFPLLSSSTSPRGTALLCSFHC
jgi:arylsulfatase I/J